VKAYQQGAKILLKQSKKLGLRSKGPKILEKDCGYQPREKMVSSIANSDSKNDNIGGPKTFLLMPI